MIREMIQDHAADGDRADALEWLDKRAIAYQALQDMG